MKTMAIRLEDDTAAQLAVLAQLEHSSIAEEIREAIAMLLDRKRSLPALADGAKRIVGEIEAESEARKAAIVSLFGKDSPIAATNGKASSARSTKSAQ